MNLTELYMCESKEEIRDLIKKDKFHNEIGLMLVGLVIGMGVGMLLGWLIL